jgi:galactonate dehydratase
MKITQIETSIPEHVMPGLIALRIHTDEGFIGNGESYYAPHAVAAMVHDWMARYLLGADPLDIEKHWRFLYERAANFGARGCELRALSAIDLALWDILGQATGLPVWRLLGGKAQDSLAIYNSSGGPTYGARKSGHSDPQGWPGHGDVGEKAPLNDYWSLVNEPEAYVESLLDEGYTAFKCWPLDFAAHKPGGALHISLRDVETALAPLHAIRERFGSRIEFMLDGHGFFQLPAAIRIAEALKPLNPLWVEDLIRPDSIQAMANLRRMTGIPMAVSEMFSGPDDYAMALREQCADYVMIDPTWVGGISQTLRITHLAQFHNVPVVYHDCTGPFTLMAGVQAGIANSNVAWQETVRAHLRLVYPKLIAGSFPVEAGRLQAPPDAGLGIRWRPEIFGETALNPRQSTLQGSSPHE